MPHIVVCDPGGVAVSLPLRGGLRAGRQEGNDLVLHDHQVSRTHARIVPEGQGWVITDLKSTHGTLVNGVKVESKRLAAGDQIQLGNVLLTFHEEDEPHQIVHQQVTEVSSPAQGDPVDRRLGVFYEVARAVGAIGDTEELLGRMLSALLDVLGCERAMAGLWDDARGGMRRITRRRDPAEQDAIIVSRAIVDAILTRRERFILQGAAPATVRRERIRSAMAVPLVLGERLFGLLYVDDREKAGRFTPEDLDFLTSLGHLTGAAIESAERYQKASAVAEALAEASPTDEIIGESPPMQRLKILIRKYGAARSSNVLIRGESGSGKELVARALHAASPRAGHPFVALNCAAIPEGMIESELFGHEKGAFTGAAREKRGKFALASGGTLFLDEIGDLDLTAQAKVLRAIQEGEIQPLGAEKTLRVDVRIISATHKDLMKEIAEKRFREDLYYRLDVVEIDVPPLRERSEDIERLARALLRMIAPNVGKRVGGFTPAALAALRQHAWPGNVRELRNEVERAAILTEAEIIDITDLSPRLLLSFAPAAAGGPRATPLAERFASLESTERQLVSAALKEARGNISEAARLLGISRIMMRRRMKRFRLVGHED